MLKKRLIPVLLLKNGLLVRSEAFSIHQGLGNPIHEVERFNEWNVDELIYIDISTDDTYDLRRDDAKIKNLDNSLAILEQVSKSCFMPLTWGGRIRSLDDARVRINSGADKITLNTAAVTQPELITECAKTFGNQAVVVCIDARRNAIHSWDAFIEWGKTPVGCSPMELAKRVEDLGAGEILLQSIDRDGEGNGYDCDLIAEVTAVTKIPVIALGGVGQFEHYVEGIKAGASAVAAANIWHFKELTDRSGKRAMAKAGIDVRPIVKG